MRIPLKYSLQLFTFRKKKISLFFSKRFSSRAWIVSLGCNCHPAHLLAIMGLRSESNPFDWLLTDPVAGLDYAVANIATEFKDYTADLKVQSDGKVFAGKFPESCFFHHSEIIDNVEMRSKLQARAKNFVRLYADKACYFLYVLPAASVTSDAVVDSFCTSINHWYKIAKKDDKLCVYLTCLEGTDENRDYCDKLIDRCKEFKAVKIERFPLYMKTYGMWGYENDYYRLLKDLNIPVSQKIPTVKLMIEQK